MICATCGNDYDKAMRLIDASGKEYWFDSFECAIHKVAPRCEHCRCPIIGHGVDEGERIFCCDRCRRVALSGDKAGDHGSHR